MAGKSEARQALEARALELGITFRTTIGDETLKARIEDAEEKQGATGVWVQVMPGETLRHDGSAYTEDQPVLLTTKQADRLEALGVVARTDPVSDEP